jgi:HKD family nuclease
MVESAGCLILIQPFSDKSIGDFIHEAFRGDHGTFDSFQAAVAFAKRSGVQHIEDELKAFIEKGNAARIVVGVDLGGTTSEGLEALIGALGESGELFVSHDENAFTTFHPKIYFFEGPDKSILIVGSGNLTQGGLYSNDEGFAILELDPSDPDDLAVIEQYKENFGKWCDEDSETVRRVDKDFIESLKESGYVSS